MFIKDVSLIIRKLHIYLLKTDGPTMEVQFSPTKIDLDS